MAVPSMLGRRHQTDKNRYIWGWCPPSPGRDNTAVGAAPNEPEWAGNLVVHRLVQHEDGSANTSER